MTHEQIVAILGVQYSVKKSWKDYEVEIWIHNAKGEPEDTTAVYYDKNGKAIYIEVVSSQFTAQGGITTQSTLAQIIAHYPNLKLSAYHVETPWGNSFEGYYYDDVPAGITFGIWASEHYDHSRTIDAISVHRPGVPMPIPIYGTAVEPTLNKPAKPVNIPTGPDSPFSKDGLPLTEVITPGGARGYTTKPIITPKLVSLLGVAVTSFRGKRIPPSVKLIFTSYSQQPRWLGESYVTFSFGGRRLRLQGVKSTEQMENGLNVEEIDVNVPVKEFLEIAKGSNLYFEIGGSRFMIEKRYLAGLRALRTKVAGH
jgi:hypothetical protein